MSYIKSHLVLDNRQRGGILLLAGGILFALGVYFYVDFGSKIDYDQKEVAEFQRKIDSLKAEKQIADQPKIYPFNPNFITDYKGYTLGMSTEEIDRLLRFREKDKWINSATDFQQVTGVSDSVLAKISPYFKFPEWVTNPKPRKTYSGRGEKSVAQKKDLNAAKASDLQTIEGLTEENAVRIINYRKRLGGFLEDNQLFDIYGLDKKLVYALKDDFTVKARPTVEPIDLNTATASDLATLPYIPFEMARDIVNYRNLHEGIKDLDELLKIEGVTTYKLDRIKLYLSTSQTEE